MAAKYQLITELYRRTGVAVAKNPQAWQGFLSLSLIHICRRRPYHTADIGIRQRLFPCGSTSPVWVCLKFRACLF